MPPALAVSPAGPRCRTIALMEPLRHPGARSAGEVDRERFEQQLAAVRARVADPVAGLFGPGSATWEVDKEAALFLGAGRAALLQLAHPSVAWAIQHHSKTRASPYARFQRTFFHVFRMIFSDLDTVLRAARAVHAVHARITGVIEVAAGPLPAGAAYRANDVDALRWVAATLTDTTLRTYDLVVRELALAEKEAYYQESKRFAQLFGVAEGALQPDWAGFQAYMERMLEGDALVVTPPAREMARFLFSPLFFSPLFPGAGPLLRRYAEITAWMLPERLARDFGLDRGGEAGRRRYEAALRRVRRVVRRLPPRLRYAPPYLQAQRRLAGDTRRDLVGDLMLRLWMGPHAAV